MPKLPNPPESSRSSCGRETWRDRDRLRLAIAQNKGGQTYNHFRGISFTMKLPNGHQAVIPMQKLIGYCLNPEHPNGKHKARVFASLLGITAENADILRELVQTAAIVGEVVQQDTTEFGQVFKVDWTVPDTNGIQLRTGRLPQKIPIHV